jgi:hypothetical protein
MTGKMFPSSQAVFLSCVLAARLAAVLASHARATPSKVCCAAVALASFSSRLALPGSIPWSSSLRAASRQPPGAGLGEGHDRILSEGQPVLLAVRLPVCHAPEFCPVRLDLEIHAFAVAQRVDLRLGFGVPDSGVRQRSADLWHFGSMAGGVLYP